MWFWLHVGALVGWLTHPTLWLIYSPARWLLYVGVTASQESGGVLTATGDGGASVGLLQFKDTTWTAILPDVPLEKRLDPYWQGYAAGVYVQTALLTRWKWWPALAIPVWGMGAMRRLWRSGIASADGAFSWADTGAPAYAGGRVWPTYLRWVLLALVVNVVLYMSFLGLKKKPVLA